MKTIFQFITNLPTILLINKYYKFILLVISIYFKTFIQLFKSLNPFLASLTFLVYVLNMANYFNSKGNFLGFKITSSTNIPTFASIIFWNNHTNIQWHKISKSQFYSFIIDLIINIIVYSLSILFTIYLFFNLLLYITNSTLFSFIITFQFSTIITIITIVLTLYIIIFCKQFLFDIGLTTWVKINILNYKLKYFNIKPFTPGVKVINNLRHLALGYKTYKDLTLYSTPFRILIATSRNTFMLVDGSEAANTFLNLPLNSKGGVKGKNSLRFWDVESDYGFIKNLLILPFTLFNSWAPNYISNNHEIILPFIPVNKDGSYMIVPGKYYLLPTYFSDSFKFLPTQMASTVNNLFKDLINLKMYPLAQRLNVFKWLLSNSTFLLVKLLNLAPVIFLAGLIIIVIIISINIIAFISGYFINLTCIYTSEIQIAFQFYSSKSFNNDYIPEIMFIYCGMCIGFIINNIISPKDKFSYKFMLLTAAFFLLITYFGNLVYLDNLDNIIYSAVIWNISEPTTPKELKLKEMLENLNSENVEDFMDCSDNFFDISPSDLDTDSKCDSRCDCTTCVCFSDIYNCRDNDDCICPYKKSFYLLFIIFYLFINDYNFLINFTEHFTLTNDFIEIIFETFLPTFILFKDNKMKFTKEQIDAVDLRIWFPSHVTKEKIEQIKIDRLQAVVDHRNRLFAQQKENELYERLIEERSFEAELKYFDDKTASSVDSLAETYIEVINSQKLRKKWI